MNQWKTKGKKKENKNVFGTTDYDIPMFSYKSAFVIILSSVIFILVGNMIGNAVHDNTTILQSIIGGLGCGGGLAFSRFFVDTKRGPVKKFWVTFVITTLIFAIFLFVFYKLNVLL